MYKNLGILTIIDNDNYGNRLQNYAVQTVLNQMNISNETIINTAVFNEKKKYLLRKIKYFMTDSYNSYSNNINRKEAFREFNKNIYFSKNKYSVYSKFNYKYLLVGSDQIWNPYFGRLREVDLLDINCKNNYTKKIAFSASFGVNKLPDKLNKLDKLFECFNNFNAISVREDSGKKILQDLGYKGKISVLIDPTMLLSAKEWDKVTRKPRMLKSKKYILNYFLGDLSEEREKEIQRVANENDCEIINILDKNSPFYECGPSEFLYLEKHAFLICTDSFHSSVFGVIYNKPFIVFEREQENAVNLSSRLDTLISKLKLENRKYNGKNIVFDNMNHDYTEAYELLEIEKAKSIYFLKKTLEKT
ncbi:polysaccharide pyruvyl transferase family protein [Thomasclavelia cocleata]|uniref:polysaccharide pyruvyl transferase family protein n=1 Tax=Thomasclavelia cocleata TaxID=69824 RepID=UPI00242B1E51|nr:polysaccharide pyruvyl transferase family protein [Thomasclavelia cocleata]